MANDVPERIVSIQTIAGVGNWDYVYPASNEPKDFQRINLIYGPNGSGKTSLANVFYGLSHDWPDAGMRTWDKVSFKVRRKDGTTLGTDQRDDAIFSRVHVFTRDMVSRSHALTVDDASMSAILTLGEEKIDREQRISELEERLGRVRDDLEEVEGREKEYGDELDNLISKFQDSVFEALARYKKWTTKGSFKRPKAKEMLTRYIERRLEDVERLLE
nr:AAA family ATPase [Schaalia odontolytica]